MIYVGLDPGLNGFITLIGDDGEFVESHKIPTIDGKGTKREYFVSGIVNIFEGIKEKYKDNKIYVMLEKPTIIPVSGKNSVASTFYCNGIMRGILATLRLPYQVISAREWQKVIFKSIDHKDTKKASIMFCSQQFPNVDFRATQRSTKLSHDKTDSTCIGYYCYLQHN